MSAVNALQEARKVGLSVQVDGGDLVLEASSPPPNAVLKLLSRYKMSVVSLLRTGGDGWSAEDWRAFYVERAGISECDGGRPRSEAEAIAFDCCIVEWLNRNPIRSEPNRCAACGGSEKAGCTLVPFGSDVHGHTWLHPSCWPDWYKARKSAAIMALSAMGIEKLSEFPNDFEKKGGG